jgi:hypothetical protein
MLHGSIRESLPRLLGRARAGLAGLSARAARRRTQMGPMEWPTSTQTSFEGMKTEAALTRQMIIPTRGDTDQAADFKPEF